MSAMQVQKKRKYHNETANSTWPETYPSARGKGERQSSNNNMPWLMVTYGHGRHMGYGDSKLGVSRNYQNPHPRIKGRGLYDDIRSKDNIKKIIFCTYLSHEWA